MKKWTESIIYFKCKGGINIMDQKKSKILMYLSQKREFVTAKDLAEEFDVSRKTIYRWIKRINDESEFGDIILSDVGKGFKLDYETYINYQTRDVNISVDNLSPENRRQRITKELLLSSPNPASINSLFEKFYLSESVIFNDEQIIANNLKKYDLSLKKKNRSLVIEGDEISIRKAIKDHIQIFNVIDIDELKNNKDLNFNRNDVLFILDQINIVESTLNISIPYPYNINIFSHLYILLNRTRSLFNFELDTIVSEQELSAMEEDSDLYHMAKLLYENIKKYLDMNLPHLEIYFIYQYLSSSRMQGSLWNSKKLEPNVIEITKLYIDEMSEKLGIDISKDSLFRDLANHVKPMLNRLNHNIKVRNRLLPEIKTTYSEIFAYVEKVSKFISEKFEFSEISEDENGFITLYFAKVIETYQHDNPIKMVIMCTTGIGTSELLKAKVIRDFPEIEILDVVSSSNYRNLSANYPDLDLILSTVRLDENISIPYLLVSSIFTQDDKMRLRNKIGELNDKHK